MSNIVGDSTFGHARYLNQQLYHSDRWRTTRDLIIIRDNGCDLGILGFEIADSLVVHHMNPLTARDVELGRGVVFNPDGLVCTSHRTHLAIHYGDKSLLPKPLIERLPGDTILW